MQRPTGRFYKAPSHLKYKHNLRWNQNSRPQTNVHNSYDFQYWCETCDKGFTTVRFLENHKLQHQKCNIDGCQFIAHPKIVTKHIQMQHSTGLFKRIAKLNNPEDIQKWREERKKKYPTMENIKKKEAEIKEKICRGEKMGMKYERPRINDNSESLHKGNHKFQHTNRMKHLHGKYNANIHKNKRVATDSSKKTQLHKKICNIIPLMEETRKLKPFAGIQALIIDDDSMHDVIPETKYNGDAIEDDEYIHNAQVTTQKEINVSEPTVCTALSSLMCFYGSSDEDNDAANKPLNEIKTFKIEDIKSNDRIKVHIHESNFKVVSNANMNSTERASQNHNVTLHSSKNKVLNCESISGEESGPEEINIIKGDSSLSADNSKILNNMKAKKEVSCRQINRQPNKTHEFRRRNKLPSTLLEKLLHREIQHERNVILQCVRYVVNNHYFEK